MTCAHIFCVQRVFTICKNYPPLIRFFVFLCVFWSKSACFGTRWSKNHLQNILKNTFKWFFTLQKLLDRSKICLFRGGGFWTGPGFSKKGKKWSKNDILSFFDMIKKSKNDHFWIFWSCQKPIFGFLDRPKIQKRVLFGFLDGLGTIQKPKKGVGGTP